MNGFSAGRAEGEKKHRIISNLFTKYELRNAPPILSFWSLPKKKERAAPGVRKKKALAWPQVTTYG